MSRDECRSVENFSCHGSGEVINVSDSGLRGGGGGGGYSLGSRGEVMWERGMVEASSLFFDPGLLMRIFYLLLFGSLIPWHVRLPLAIALVLLASEASPGY